MTLDELVNHFGTKSEVARALNVTRQAVDNCRRYDSVPKGKQFEAQVMTLGKLQAEKD